jgi:hypothetical protein
MNKYIRKKGGQKTHILCDSVREEPPARSKGRKRTMLKYKSERKDEIADRYWKEQ